MPLRTLVKLCWGISGAVLLFIAGSMYLLFSGKMEAAEKKFEEPAADEEITRPATSTFEDLKAIWDTKISVEGQKKIEVIPPKETPLQQHLKEITIKNIFSPELGMISVGGQDIKVRPAPTPFRKQNQNDEWKWEVRLSKITVSVERLEPQTGILFNNGKEGKDKEAEWVHYDGAGKKKDNGRPRGQNTSPGNRPGADPSDNERREKVGENHWKISEAEEEDLLDDYDAFVEELAPEISADPPGLQIRRVRSDSKTYEYGLRENDVVTNINGKKIRSEEDIQGLLEQDHTHEKSMVVTVLRKDGDQWRTVTFTFESR